MTHERENSLLIVDDQSEVRSLLFYALSGLAYRLYMASDGDSALASYEVHQPDIIVLDIMLPGDLSGLDVCRRIKLDNPRPPKVILLSALSSPTDIARGYDAGADAYITKPFSPMGLIREIHRLSRVTA